MPYKNPEHKRQWEREHRKQRNAQRRMKRLERKNDIIARNPAADPNSERKPKSGWKGIIGLAVGLGIVLLTALGGVSVPSPGSFEPPPTPGDTGRR
jgi:ferric-dicitrate binding protein FerR (iron transport regulator)